MVSQSIFLVSLTVYDGNGSSPFNGTWNDWTGQSYAINTIDCVYSNIVVMLSTILGALAVIFLLGNGMRKFEPGIPVSAGCSAIISAACHTFDYDDVDVYKEFKWGVVKKRTWQVLRNCCITNEDVESHIAGHFRLGFEDFCLEWGRIILILYENSEIPKLQFLQQIKIISPLNYFTT
jgi:hypothetical protein